MRVLTQGVEPAAFRDIEAALRIAKGPDGASHEIVAVLGPADLLKRLAGEHFDVVILGVRIEDKPEGGLAILRGLRERSPIKIVVSPHPSARECVACMRLGAWDCLDVATPDFCEKLVQSVQDAYAFRLAHPEAGRSNPDSTWVREHLGELVDEYGGEVVAVLDGKVVDHDERYGRLMERVKKHYPVARATIVSIPDARVEAIE